MGAIERLTVKNVGKTYGGSIALTGVSCEFEKGNIYGIVGENGAGKSTLMKIINGTVAPDEGSLEINGSAIEMKSPSDAQRVGIGMVYQELNLLPNLSIMENVYISHLSSGKTGYINWKKIKEETQKYLDIFKVDLKPTDQVGELKAAHQQIVAIIRAYAMNSSLIILDEPTSALPIKEIHVVLDVVRKLKELGCIVLYISHKLGEILTLCDQLIALRNGHMIGTYKTQEFTKDSLATLIAGRELKQKFPKMKFERGEEILRFENVSVPGLLENISFTLYQGEILGFAGLLGAGKTEIAKTIFGIFGTGYTGNIYYQGKKVSIRNSTAAVKNKIGLVPENRGGEGLIHDKSVAENISIASLGDYSRLGCIENRRLKKKVDELVARVGVKCASVSNNIMSLSGGNQQKVVLSKWLTAEAKLVVFDEPTRGIDVGAKHEIYQIMNELVKQGVGVMIMSSENDEVVNMCDRIVLLKEGHMLDIIDAENHTEEDLEEILA